MINLLPSIGRKTIIFEYWVRAVSVWLFMMAVASMALVFLSLPVYVLVNTQVDLYVESASASAERVAEYDLSAKSIVQINHTAEQIFELRQKEDFGKVVSLIRENTARGVEITAFELSRGLDGKILPVSIVGSATDRQALADFRNAILALPEVAEALLPISNLAKDKDIDFTMSIVLDNVGT